MLQPPITTFPESNLITSARPNIVLVEDKETLPLQLTITHNSVESIPMSYTARKFLKRSFIQSLRELERKSLSTSLLTIEIGSLGHWTHKSLKSLSNLKAVPSLSKRLARAITNEVYVAMEVVRASRSSLMFE